MFFNEVFASSQNGLLAIEFKRFFNPANPPVIEETVASGRIPDSHEHFGHRWPLSMADGTANAELIDGTLVITFNQQAPASLPGNKIGFVLYRRPDGNFMWQCGSGTVQGQLVSARDGRQMTSVDERHLPADCR